MVFRMRATLNIPDALARELRRQAAKRGTTMSELSTELLRKGLILELRATRKPKRPFRFPTFKTGPLKVNVADRDELYEFLEADRDARLYATRQPRRQGERGEFVL